MPNEPASLPQQQAWLIDYIEALFAGSGKPVEREGVCFGVSSTGMLAILARNVPRYNERLRDLRNIPLETYTGTVVAAKNVQENILAIMKKNLEMEENERLSIQQQDIKSIPASRQKKFREKLQSRLGAIQEQTDALHRVMDTEIFLQNIQLIQETQAFPELFPAGTSNLARRDIKPILRLLTPVVLEQQGGVEEIESFTGVYSRKRLQKVLGKLRNSLERDPPAAQPVSFLVSMQGHSISIGYDPKLHLWILINANALPARFINSEHELVNAMFEGFFNKGDYIALTSKMYATKDSLPDLQPRINEWKNSDAWKKAHRVTSRKVNEVVFPAAPWLNHAIFEGNEGLAKKILRKRADPNRRDMFGRSGLHNAATAGSPGLIKKLVKYNADLEAEERNHITPLMIAVGKRKDLKIVRALLEAGADPNHATDEKITPAAFAIGHRQLGIFECLLDYGANPDEAQTVIEAFIAGEDKRMGYFAATLALFRDGTTPLCVCAEKGDIEEINHLLDNGADIDRGNKFGVTPLIKAIESGDPDVVRLLLQRGADPDKSLPNGFTPLMFAARFGRTDVVSALLDHGADAFRVNNAGDTAFSIIRSKAGNVTSIFESRIPAVCIAAATGDVQELTKLLQDGAAPEVRDNRGRTALQLAAEAGHLRAVEALLDFGANPQTPGSNDTRVIETSRKKGFFEISETMASHINKMIPLNILIMQNKYQAVDNYLAKGTDPNRKDGRNQTPLILALLTGAPEAVIQSLLKAGANKDYIYEDMTPLTIAVLKNNRAAVHILLEHGADPFLSAGNIANAFTLAKIFPELASLMQKKLEERQAQKADQPAARLGSGHSIFKAEEKTPAIRDTRVPTEKRKQGLRHDITPGKKP